MTPKTINTTKTNTQLNSDLHCGACNTPELQKTENIMIIINRITK